MTMRIYEMLTVCCCLLFSFPVVGSPDPSGRSGGERMKVTLQDGRYYLDLPSRFLDRDFLVTTTILEASARSRRYGEQRYGYAGDRLDAQVVRMKRVGQELLLLQP